MDERTELRLPKLRCSINFAALIESLIVNRLTFSKVIAKNKVSPLYGTQCIDYDILHMSSRYPGAGGGQSDTEVKGPVQCTANHSQSQYYHAR